MNENIEMLLLAKKIRYEYLDELIKETNFTSKKDKSPNNTINIFIDLYDVIKQLYKPDIVESINSINVTDKQDIASEIINMIGHYRHYFFSRHWKYTTFYLIYSNKRSKYHTELYPEYRHDFYMKRLREPKSNKFLPQYDIMNTMLESVIKIIRGFVQYIPHVYFIDSGDVDYTLIPYIITQTNMHEYDRVVNGEKEKIYDPADPSIIISNDTIFYQDLVSANVTNIAQLLCKNKNSELLLYTDIYDYMTKGLKKKPDISYSIDLLTVVQAFMGYDKYNIPKVNKMGIGRAMNFVEKNLFSTGILPDIIYTSESLFKEYLYTSKIKDEYKEQALLNFKLLSHDSMEYNNAFTKTDIIKIVNQCKIELVDAKAVRKNNEKFFYNNPINTEFCYDGEAY